MVDCSKYGSTYVCSDGACVGKGVKANPVKYGDWTIYSDLGKTNEWARIIIWDAAGNTVDTLVINQGSSKTSTTAEVTITLNSVEADDDGTVKSADFTVQSTTASSTCSETDGGLKYETKGTCSSRDNGDNYDTCDSLTTLSETYCSSFEEAKAKYGDTVHGPMCFRKAVDCAVTMGTGYVCLKGECVKPTGMTRYNPSVILMPSSSASGADVVEYTVFVKNEDYGKTSSRFELTYNVFEPGPKLGVRCGFVTSTGTVARTVVTINPGEAVYTPLKLWTTSKKLSETIGFNVMATNTEDPKYWGIAEGAAQFGVEETATALGTKSNPVKNGNYLIYSDLGFTGTWARVIVTDTAGNTLTTLTIDEDSSKIFVGGDLKVRVSDIVTESSGETTSINIQALKIVNPVIVGNYYVFGDLGLSDSWARIEIVPTLGNTPIDSLILNKGQSKISLNAMLKATLNSITTTPEGIVTHISLKVEVVSGGSISRTSSFYYGDYSISSATGSDNSWAKISIKDSHGNEVDSQIVKQGDSWTSEKAGLKITVLKVHALADEAGTIVGVDIIVEPASTGTTENPAVSTVRNFYTWLSGLWRQ